MQILEKNKKFSKNCLVRRASGHKMQVDCRDNLSFTIDLVAKICVCRQWQLSGIPCGHALACIWEAGHDPVDYVHDWYKRESFEKAYVVIIEPMPSLKFWLETSKNPIHPPKETNLPRRPKKKRRREADEIPASTRKKNRRFGQVHGCTKCGQTGHTKKNCNNVPPPPPRVCLLK